jgi:hypothetical protein
MHRPWPAGKTSKEPCGCPAQKKGCLWGLAVMKHCPCARLGLKSGDIFTNL